MNFAVMVALARRRSIPEVEQLMAPPLGPAEALQRVRGLLADPQAAPLRAPAWRRVGAVGSCMAWEAGGGAGQGDELPPVPQMKVGACLVPTCVHVLPIVI